MRVVLERGEHDRLNPRSLGHQPAVDDQLIYPAMELYYHARLDGERDAAVHDYVAGDDVRTIGQRPGGVAGDMAADICRERHTLLSGPRWRRALGQQDRQ